MRHNVTSQRSDRASSLRAWLRRAAICGLAACGLGLGSGCERTPDPCVDFKLACLALTVEDGPAGIRRLSVFIDDGMVQYTQATPMKPPKTALVYPLRFGVRFGEFDNAYRGFVRVEVSALNDEYDVVGFAQEQVPIGGRDHQSLRLRLSTPPAAPDMADPPVDMGSPPDMADPAMDMTPVLDMP